jgi:predicted Fe-S protein YdhL (DUF1289 family)
MTSATSRDTEAAVACKKICKIDESGLRCSGCKRTMDQIIKAYERRNVW